MALTNLEGGVDLEAAKDAPITPALTIATLALNFALKYHDINTIQDGTLYQQYKLEGKNINPLHLDMVFETAIAMERHLLESSDRVAHLIVEALTSEGIPGTESEEGPTHPIIT